MESLTSHFVFSLAISRGLTLLFWVTCWKELNYNTTRVGSYLAGRSILLSQFLQIILMATTCTTTSNRTGKWCDSQ